MSNYLQNLIAKNFNRAELARPRLASMFEPLAPNSPAAFGETQLIESLDFERAPHEERNTNMRQENRQDRESKKALQLQMMNQPAKEIETSVWRGNQQPVTLEQKTTEAQILHRQPTPQHQFDVQPLVPLASEKAQQENASPKPRFSNRKESNLQPTRQRNEEASFEDAVPPGRALIQRGEKNPLKPSVPVHSKIPAPTPMQNESTQIRRPINGQLAKHEMKESNLAYLPVASEANRIIVQPRSALSVESQRASGKVNSSPQQSFAQAAEVLATPTINVTIGRIEIRATPAATAQTRKQPSVAQTMSLDEYLRKRNRGGRE